MTTDTAIEEPTEVGTILILELHLLELHFNLYLPLSIKVALDPTCTAEIPAGNQVPIFKINLHFSEMIGTILSTHRRPIKSLL